MVSDAQALGTQTAALASRFHPLCGASCFTLNTAQEEADSTSLLQTGICTHTVKHMHTQVNSTLTVKPKASKGRNPSQGFLAPELILSRIACCRHFLPPFSQESDNQNALGKPASRLL